MSTDSLRIGIIGAGGNTRKMHIPGFQAIEGVEVVVVCNRSEASSRAAADEFGISRIASTWTDVIEDPEVDAVCIGTWPYMHAEASIAALEAGKHVLTEARIARNAAEARKMLETSLRFPDRVAQVVPSPFTFAYDATIKDLIAAGELGALREIVAVHATPGAASAETPLTWRQDYELSGNNILSLGINHEAVMRWIDGDLQRVRASGAIYTPNRHDERRGETVDVEVPDRISVEARYSTGLNVLYHVTGLEPIGPRHMIQIYGTRAALHLDIVAGTLSIARLGAGAAEAVTIAPDKRGKWEVEADFVASIRDGKPVELTSFATGVEYMRFTDAVGASWRDDGSWVVPD